jgi:hypothetical protein
MNLEGYGYLSGLAESRNEFLAGHAQPVSGRALWDNVRRGDTTLEEMSEHAFAAPARNAGGWA